MSNDFRKLLELEKIDLRIIELEQSKEEYPKTVEKLEKVISDAKAGLENIEARLEDARKEKKAVEEQKANAQLSLEKSQERLNSVKTNKEYDAVHTEIETHKNILSTADKKILRFSDEIYAIENELNEAKGEYDKTVEANQPQIDELKEKIATIDSAIAEVVTERESLVPDINKRYVRTYDHIRAGRKRGVVISLVEGTHGNCSVCYQKQQPQVVNEVRKGKDIIYCQNCGSILIWKAFVEDETGGES